MRSRHFSCAETAPAQDHTAQHPAPHRSSSVRAMRSVRFSSADISFQPTSMPRSGRRSMWANLVGSYLHAKKPEKAHNTLRQKWQEQEEGCGSRRPARVGRRSMWAAWWGRTCMEGEGNQGWRPAGHTVGWHLPRSDAKCCRPAGRQASNTAGASTAPREPPHAGLPHWQLLLVRRVSHNQPQHAKHQHQHAPARRLPQRRAPTALAARSIRLPRLPLLFV